MTITTQIRTNAIPLPKTVSAKWKNQEVVIEILNDTLIVKRVMPPSWDTLLPKLRKVGKEISKKTITQAIKWARRQS